MARSVKVSQFQAMQRGESDAGGDRQTSSQNVAAIDPLTGQLVDADPPLTIPEQLAALELKGSGDMSYDELVRRLGARASLLDIPAMPEEIAAEARRRCELLPETERRHGMASDWNETGGTGLEDGEDASSDSPRARDDDALSGGLPIDITGFDQSSPTRVEGNYGWKPPTMAEQIQALGVEASCTAEMSLSMIVGRVKDAAFDAKLDPTDAEIVAEAERIWFAFDDNRRGPAEREYDVVNGEVRDWRRPDTTPDRGDVTTVHQVDGEQRFSGAGAEDAQQQGLFLVPNDADFKGKLYRGAPELANIAERLIGQHGFLKALVNCEIRWYWKRKTGVSKGRVKIGFMKRASDLLGHFSGADFIGWLSATTARDGKFTDTQVEAAVLHQLCHVGQDDKGNWIFSPHDFEGFAQEVRHYGTWTSDLKLGGTAFVAAHQMGLFSDDEEDEDEDEGEDLAATGAGVLIHPDGTPLSADEIAEQEAAELADDDMEETNADLEDRLEDALGDEPSDPDGPAPDEDDDLADLPFA